MTVGRWNIVTVTVPVLMIAAVSMVLAAWPDVDDATACGSPPRASDATSSSGDRLSDAAVAALQRLSDASPALVALDSNAGFGHSQVGTAVMTAQPADVQARLDAQLECARRAALEIATPEKAAAAGYAQGSTRTIGVGEHWIDWTAVGRPFDPSHPSMVLFSSRRLNGPLELVGFSYWVGSDSAPEGFAGSNDHWHRHIGLCFENGWLTRQAVGRKADCPGAFLAGSNLWMLHAWVVDGVPSRWGIFSDVNPSLCAAPATTPDVLRCNPNER